MRSASLLILSSLLLPLAFANPAFARSSDDDDEEGSSDESPGKTEGADVRSEDEDGNKESKKELDPGEIEKANEAEKANSPLEDPSKTYYFVGLRYRGMIMPKYMVDLFADNRMDSMLYVNGFGPEFTVRKDNFEYVLSAWWAGYNMPNSRFRAYGDPATGWEYVKANINVLYFTADFNWTHQINPIFGLNLGLGAGLGITWGDIIRNEAYQDSSSNNKWRPCSGENQANDPQDLCDPKANKDAQYNYHEKSWANGGSKPFVFPWLALQTGMRIKPHRNVMMRIDLGYAITGPFFGLSGNYGL